MILFLISFLMIAISSYLITSLCGFKKYLSGVTCTMLAFFAQVILTIEILSLFGVISKVGILILNFVFLCGTIFLWNRQGKPIWQPQFREFFAQALKAIKKDKMLGVMCGGFCIFILVSLFLNIVLPILEYDAMAYHVNRALAWVAQGSLNHFPIADDRNINMPINSELLYTWFFAFVPRNILLGLFGFASYVFTACSLYSILELLGFCMRKRLWTVFLMSSLAGVVLETSGVEINTLVGGLILSCVSFFILAMKKDSQIACYLASLALAIVVGTKSTTFFLMPALALILGVILYHYKRGEFFKYLGRFIGYFAINFLVFSVYNYILNFIDFGNPIGSTGTRLYHGLKGGVKGYVSGFIRHSLLLLDFSGFSYGAFIQKHIFGWQDNLLTYLGIPLDLNVINSNSNQFNFTLNDSRVGGGVVGILVLIPSAIIAIFKGVINHRNYKKVLFAMFGLVPFLSIVVMSACIGYMLFSSRFILSFLVVASPVMVFSYIRSNKNLFKYIILFYVMSYFVLISTHIWARHFVSVTRALKQGQSISLVRQRALCATALDFDGHNPYCSLKNFISNNMPKGSRIGVFGAASDNLAVLKFMEVDGYKFDYLVTQLTHQYNLRDYDYLVFTHLSLDSTYVLDIDGTINNYYVYNGKIYFKDSNRASCVIFDEYTDGRKMLILSGEANKLNPVVATCLLPENIMDTNGFQKIAQIIYGDDENGKPDPNSSDRFVIFKKN